MKCANCQEEIRPVAEGDGIDPADREYYAWVNEFGNPICDGTPVHEPARASYVWIVIDEDRHEDVEVLPFSTEQSANAAARERAGDMTLPDGVSPDQVDHVPGEQELTQDQLKAGWVLCLVYSIEGDSVRVVKRQMAP
jgi:hypothetical protein